jgi:hypothetical protein
LGDCGSLARHLCFSEYYITLGEKYACFSDIKDMVFSDLPTESHALVQRDSSDSHLDEKLRNSVMPLVRGRHYDSAVRKAFVVLTERLRQAFGVLDDIDGEQLVNAGSGGKGKLAIHLDEPKRKGYRNLFSGFYVVLRNRYAHADVEPDLSEAKAIVEMTNSLLHEVEGIASRSVEEGLNKLMRGAGGSVSGSVGSECRGR